MMMLKLYFFSEWQVNFKSQIGDEKSQRLSAQDTKFLLHGGHVLSVLSSCLEILLKHLGVFHDTLFHLFNSFLCLDLDTDRDNNITAWGK